MIMSPSHVRPRSGRVPSGRMLAIMTFILAVVACILLIGTSDDSSAESGNCGDNAKWELNSGVLTISGTGEINRYYSGSYEPYIGSIKMVAIEEGITYIGSFAFNGGSSIDCVMIPGTVTDIGNDEFKNCSSLKHVNMETGLKEIHNDAFMYCYSLKTLTIPNSVTNLWLFSIGDGYGLKDIYFGTGLETGAHLVSSGGVIGRALYASDGTTEIDDTYYDNIKGKHFKEVDGKLVEQSSIPTQGNVNGNIGWSFSGGTLTVYGTGTMDDYDTGDQQPWGTFRGTISEIIVSDGVTRIGDRAFTFCGHATSVKIANSVISIGADALSYTTDLKTITLPSGLTSIDDYAFRYSGITAITIPVGVTGINHGTFMYCIGMSSAEIPDTVTNIAAEGFLGCINIKELYIGNGLIGVAEDSFTDVDLYDYDETTLITKDTTHLKGAMFVNKSDKAVRLNVDLVADGPVCSKTSETHSASLSNDDMIYLKKKASLDADTELRIMLEGGIAAAFDRIAIHSLGNTALTITIKPMDPSELSESVKKLAKNNIVYDVSLSGYADLGDGKVRMTVPFAASDAGINAILVKDNAADDTITCTCADGKATFETSKLEMFFVESTDSSGGGGSGEFPVWIPVIISIVALTGIAGVMFYLRKRKL